MGWSMRILYPDFVQELLVISVIFYMFLPKRNHTRIRLIVAVSILWIGIATVSLYLTRHIDIFTPLGKYAATFTWYSIFYLGIPLLGVFLFFVITTKITMADALYATALVYAVQHIGYCVTTFVSGKTVTHTILVTLMTWFFYLLVTVPLAIFLSYSFHCEQGYGVSWTKALLNFLLICFLALFLNWGVRNYTVETNQFFYNACNIYDMCCLLFILLVQIQQCREVELKSTIAVERMLRDKMKEQYAVSKENIEIINRKSHDLKHQIGMLRHMPANEEREDFLTKLERDVTIYDNTMQTGNEALNIVLTEKGLLCYDQQIQWTCMVDGHLMDFMKTIDVYTLFGNALDNAIEACRKVNEVDCRVISITVLKRAGVTVVEIENYFDGVLQKNGNQLMTRKTEKSSHGLGMGSMRQIVDTYGGTMKWEAKDQIFCLTMAFPFA